MAALVRALAAVLLAAAAHAQSATPTASPWGFGDRVCVTIQQGSTGSITCPLATETIGEVVFASYGTPTGGCTFAQAVDPTCHSSNSIDVAAAACLGLNTCSIKAASGSGGFNTACGASGKMCVCGRQPASSAVRRAQQPRQLPKPSPPHRFHAPPLQVHRHCTLLRPIADPDCHWQRIEHWHGDAVADEQRHGNCNQDIVPVGDSHWQQHGDAFWYTLCIANRHTQPIDGSHAVRDGDAVCHWVWNALGHALGDDHVAGRCPPVTV